VLLALSVFKCAAGDGPGGRPSVLEELGTSAVGSSVVELARCSTPASGSVFLPVGSVGAVSRRDRERRMMRTTPWASIWIPRMLRSHPWGDEKLSKVVGVLGGLVKNSRPPRESPVHTKWTMCCRRGLNLKRWLERMMMKHMNMLFVVPFLPAAAPPSAMAMTACARSKKKFCTGSQRTSHTTSMMASANIVVKSEGVPPEPWKMSVKEGNAERAERGVPAWGGTKVSVANRNCTTVRTVGGS
jgi:hypothetical protein